MVYNLPTPLLSYTLPWPCLYHPKWPCLRLLHTVYSLLAATHTGGEAPGLNADGLVWIYDGCTIRVRTLDHKSSHGTLWALPAFSTDTEELYLGCLIHRLGWKHSRVWKGKEPALEDRLSAKSKILFAHKYCEEVRRGSELHLQ